VIFGMFLDYHEQVNQLQPQHKLKKMKNLKIRSNFGTGLESIVDKGSCYGPLGTVGNSWNSNSRPVYSPYTNIRTGSLEKDYSGQEFFKSNYEVGRGTKVNRSY
jgi:hypothetical protein